MNIKRISVIALCMLFIVPLCANAAVIDTPRINADTSVVTLSGQIPGADSPGMITYEIIKPGKYSEEFDVSSAKDIKKNCSHSVRYSTVQTAAILLMCSLPMKAETIQSAFLHLPSEQKTLHISMLPRPIN